MEVLPDLSQEVEEGQKKGMEGMEPAVEAAWGGDVAEEPEVFGEGQGLVVLAAELQGGGDGQGVAFPSGKHLVDGGCGRFGLGVILVAQGLESIVYNASHARRA
ncbi:hypothetical protein FJNA_01700 [Thermus sp. FJN-A]